MLFIRRPRRGDLDIILSASRQPVFVHNTVPVLCHIVGKVCLMSSPISHFQFVAGSWAVIPLAGVDTAFYYVTKGDK